MHQVLRCRFLSGLGQVLLVTALSLAGCGNDSKQAPTRFTLRFAPSDGTEFVQKMSVTRIQEISTGERITDRSKSQIHFVIEKTDFGYRVEANQLESTTTRNGEPREDLVSKLLQEQRATYEVDPNGQVLAIRGFENISDRIATELPAELSEVLAPVLTEKFLVKRGKEEWGQRYGEFAGKTIEIGDIWESLPKTRIAGGGEVNRYTVTWFQKTRRCGEKHCVRVRIFYNSHLDALREELATTLGERAEDLFKNIEATDPKAMGTEISGEIDRLVDPDTMLPQMESELRVTTRVVTHPEQGTITLTITETKDYEFDYSGFQPIARKLTNSPS